MSFMVVCTGATEPDGVPGLLQPRVFFAETERLLDEALDRVFPGVTRVTHLADYDSIRDVPLGAWWTIADFQSLMDPIAYVVKVLPQETKCDRRTPGFRCVLPGSNDGPPF